MNPVADEEMTRQIRRHEFQSRSLKPFSRFAAEWSAADLRCDLLTGACALLLGLFALCTMIAAGYLNHTKLPLWDAWDLWGERLTQTNLWSLLSIPHNSHIIPVPRLLYLADEKWFHGDTRSLQWLTFLSQFGTAVILYRLACTRDLAIGLRAMVLGLIFAFVFAAPQWINYTSALQVCFVLAFSTAIAAFAALYESASSSAHPKRVILWLVLSLVLALISVGTAANGLLVWPLLAVLAAFLRLPKSVVATLAVLALGLMYAYAHSYHPSAPLAVWDLFDTSPDMIAFALAYLGSALDEPVMAVTKAIGLNLDAYRVLLTAIAGGLGIAWFVQIVANAIVGRQRASPRQITLLHIAAFMLGSAGLTSLGRIQFSVKAALTSRYTTPSVLFWACLIVLAIIQSDSDSTRTERRTALRVAALLAGLLVGGLLQLPKVSYALASERYLSEGEYAIINGAFEPSLWERFFYASGPMIPVVRHLRENKLGSFSRAWTHWVGSSALSHFRVVPSASTCIGAWQYSNSLGNSFHPGTVSEGWAYDQRARRAPRQLVFVDNAHHILGFSSSTRRRPDVIKQHQEFADDRVGWVAYLPIASATDARLYAVLADGKSVCAIASMRLPGAYTTAPAAKAGQVIAGVRPNPADEWVASLPPGAPVPPFTTELWSSHLLQHPGVLRLGPVNVAGGSRIGLPLVTGPGATGIHVSVIERGTNETIANADAPAGTAAWDLWRLDIPAGAPVMVLDYVVERTGRAAGDWVVVASPRYVNP